MRRWMVQMGTATVILVISLGLLLAGHSEADEGQERAVIWESRIQLVESEQGTNVSFCFVLGANESIRIDSWKQGEKRYLFLPSMFREQEVVFDDDVLVLEEGELLLSDSSGNSVELEICFGSEIPFAYMETDSGNLQFLQESKDHKETGNLYFVNSDQTMAYADKLDKVKIRGNATRHQPKVPFRIGLAENASLAGLDASKDYVLLAEYGDVSLMHNKVAMKLANTVTDQYQPDGEHIDLYVNGEYMGVYLLCEGISIGENRLELDDLEAETEVLNGKDLKEYPVFAEMSGEDTMIKGYEIPKNPDDISGGYLLELEYHGRYEGEETTGFRTDQDWSLVLKEPSRASREQVEYIRDCFQQVENAMYAEDWMDPDSGKPLEELMDMESFVHKYMMDEICMNTDPWTSQFLYKKKGEDKFCFGPMWDYDMAFGHYDTGFSPKEFYCNWHIWYGEVYEHPDFWEILQRAYKEKYLPFLKELTETGLDEWKHELAASARMNFTRWNIEEIYSRNFVIRRGDSFEQCVDFLKEFIEARTEFLSSEWLENH